MHYPLHLLYCFAFGLNLGYSLTGSWPEALLNMAAVAMLVVTYNGLWLPRKVARLW